MGFADDIADLLTTGGFTSASIFRGDLPERPNKAIVITQTMGLGSGHTFGSTAGNAPMQHMRFQVRARATDYTTAETVANAADALLDGLRNGAINGTTYQWITGNTSPFYIGLDDEERPLFGCNYTALKSLNT